MPPLHYSVPLSAAFWDATRAFMLLSILSCFAGIILGLTTFSSSARLTRTRMAGITLLIAGMWVQRKATKLIGSLEPFPDQERLKRLVQYFGKEKAEGVRTEV